MFEAQRFWRGLSLVLPIDFVFLSLFFYTDVYIHYISSKRLKHSSNIFFQKMFDRKQIE